MSNVKISELPEASSLDTTDLIPVVNDGITKRAAFSLLPFLQSGTGAVTRSVQSKLRDVVSVDDFGAVGDGSTDDTAAINAAGLAAYTAGGGTVSFGGDKTYALGRRVVGSQTEGGILMHPGVNWEGNNCELKLTNNCHFFVGYSADSYFSWTTKATITGNVLFTDTVFTVDSSSGFTAGDDVFVRLGDHVDDSNEPTFWLFAKVDSVGVGTITLDRPALQAVTIASVTNSANKRIYRIPTSGFLENVEVRNFYLNNDETGSANAEGACNILCGRNITFTNVRARNPGPGFIGQFCENLWFKNISVPECDKQAAHTAKGRAFTFSSCNSSGVDGWFAGKLEDVVALVEFGCKGVEMRGGKLSQDRTSTPDLFAIANASELLVSNLTIYGLGAFVLYDEGGSVGNTIKFRNTNMRITSAPTFAGIPGTTMVGLLDMNINGTAEYYNLDLPRFVDGIIELTDGMSSTFSLPTNGLLGLIEMWLSTAAAAADFDSVTVRRPTADGAELKASLTADQWKTLSFNTSNIIGTNAGTHWSNRAEPLQVFIDTVAATVTGLNKHLGFRTTAFPKSTSATTAPSAIDYSAIGNGVMRMVTKGEFVATGAATVNPASLAPGASDVEFTIPVAGALLGDYVEVSFSLDTQGIEFPARVSASDTVKAYPHNPDGNPNGTVNLASGTVRAVVTRR